jgi:hypothetical protein
MIERVFIRCLGNCFRTMKDDPPNLITPGGIFKLIQAAVADVGSHDLQRALLQSHELATFFEEVEAGPEAEFLGTLIFDDF